MVPCRMEMLPLTCSVETRHICFSILLSDGADCTLPLRDNMFYLNFHLFLRMMRCNVFAIGPVGGLNGTDSTEMIFEDLLRYRGVLDFRSISYNMRIKGFY